MLQVSPLHRSRHNLFKRTHNMHSIHPDEPQTYSPYHQGDGKRPKVIMQPTLAPAPQQYRPPPQVGHGPFPPRHMRGLMLTSITSPKMRPSMVSNRPTPRLSDRYLHTNADLVASRRRTAARSDTEHLARLSQPQTRSAPNTSKPTSAQHRSCHRGVWSHEPAHGE